MKLIAPACSIALAIGTLAAAPAHADGWGTASDVGRDVLVAASLGAPVVQGDWDGARQAGFSLIAAGGTTYALKELIPETRPDGSDARSFPSGHTSVSFAAAATLENRYGWEAGLPAFALASFVGVARVQGHRHYWHDVIAGAALGTASGFLLTRKHDARVQWVPWAEPGGGGMTLSARF